jgi:hypothetical protein
MLCFPSPYKSEFRALRKVGADTNIVGWSNAVAEPAFGSSNIGGDASIKSKLINLMTSVRTLMRSMCPYISFAYPSSFGVLALKNKSLEEIYVRKGDGK